ncbi:RidA family protein [Succinispira mobilis]|uniref:RidA family protein n=1 Tax=Succinispira mobilis TaxID=78120 RepID=UPI0003676CC2|nr:RidA family protein [Succinispira mobilis]
MNKIISTKLAPQAIGPYSQAIKVQNQLFASGQIAINPATNEFVGGDITSETHQVMNNIKALLQSEGLTFDNVFKTTVFLADMNDFQNFNSVYATYFPNIKPARSCVQVAQLPKNAKVEVEIIASYE